VLDHVDRSVAHRPLRVGVRIGVGTHTRGGMGTSNKCRAFIGARLILGV
jgi:hypothetical protein